MLFLRIKYGYWKWVGENKSSGLFGVGESSGSASTKSTTQFPVEEFSRIFQTIARIYEEDDVVISLNVTMSKGKGSVLDNGKGKGPA